MVSSKAQPTSPGRYDEPWDNNGPNGTKNNYDSPWGDEKSTLNYDEPWDAIGSTNGTISFETGKTRWELFWLISSLYWVFFLCTFRPNLRSVLHELDG